DLFLDLEGDPFGRPGAGPATGEGQREYLFGLGRIVSDEKGGSSGAPGGASGPRGGAADTPPSGSSSRVGAAAEARVAAGGALELGPLAPPRGPLDPGFTISYTARWAF